MRFDGTLKKWNAERGFGFIVADQGGPELFVHVSAFPRDGRLPAVGESLSFEVESNRDGKKCAVRLHRHGASRPIAAYAARSNVRRSSNAPVKSGFGSSLIALVIVAALGWFGYTQYANRVALSEAAATQSVFVPPAPGGFQCDGRKYCSQMTSCKEAKLFLKNCPGVEMDGNHDGVPCEQQWCTSPFAN